MSEADLQFTQCERCGELVAFGQISDGVCIDCMSREEFLDAIDADEADD
ncbi:hypothetical protein [Haloferax volcanii]|nr:hypothetical protein [Haloferax alexandrinus]